MATLPLPNTDLVRLMQGTAAKRAILIINLILVVWIASTLAMLVWDLVAPAEMSESGVVDAGLVTAAAVPDPDVLLVKQLPGMHIMGEVDKAAPPVKTSVPVDAPDTRLKLELRGSLASDNPEQARAIIADPKGKEDQYAIGDKVPGNAELSEIHPDRVILLRNGRYETLRLPETSKKGSSSRISSPRSNSAAANRLRNLQQQARTRPRSLYGIMRTAPVQAEGEGQAGKLRGYKVSPGRDKALFDELGLQDGDLVTQVNDVRLDTAENGMQALKSIQSGDSVNLTIERDGAEQVMTFALPAQ